MILSYNELLEIVNEGVINPLVENINGASIDIRLGSEIKLESGSSMRIVDIQEKQALKMTSKIIPEDGYLLYPGECILAHSIEIFNLPDNLSAEYVLKSSMARCFLNHMYAGFADPLWHGQLVLELKNESRFHIMRLHTGMKIGQIKFYKHKPVPHENSYAVHGRYNGSVGAMESEGV